MGHWKAALCLPFVVAGCSTIAGLDSVRERGCAPHCTDGSVPIERDAATDSSSLDTGPADATSPDGTGSDTSTGMEAAADTSTGDDVSPEASLDASQDSSSDALAETSSDGPAEADGCGPTNTVENCGACGQSCASTSVSTTSASCSGTSCTYTCGTDSITGADGGPTSVAAYLDCNAQTGYDPDGCECSATQTNMPIACCGTSCPVQHNDGLSGGSFPSQIYFYDCNPVGTHTNTSAMAACTNYAGGPANSSNCLVTTCNSGESAVCELAGTFCPCWQYTGTSAGQVAVDSAGSCSCPGDSGVTTTSWQ